MLVGKISKSTQKTSVGSSLEYQTLNQFFNLLDFLCKLQILSLKKHEFLLLILL